MSDQRANDTEVMINLGLALDEEINTITVTDAVEAINDKIDTVIDSVVELSEKPKYIYKVSVLCECGGSYVYRNKTRHYKTVKHQNYCNKKSIIV